MRSQSKKEILEKLMQKIPLIKQQKLKQGYQIRKQQHNSNNQLQISPSITYQNNETYYPDSHILYQLTPGFNVNNQSTYKMHFNQQKKKSNLNNSFYKLQTEPSNIFQANASKISLSPRPTKRQIKLINTPILTRRMMIKSSCVKKINQDYRKPSYSDWDMESWNISDDINNNSQYSMQ